MKTINGVRLLSDYRALNRWFATLDVRLHRATDQQFDKEELHQDELAEQLLAKHRLIPVHLGLPTSVTVDVFGDLYRIAGEVRRMHLAALSVPFDGSHLLLRTAPEPGYHFPYKGRIGKEKVKLLHLLPDLDPSRFVSDASEHLDRARDALHRMQVRIADYNERVTRDVDRKVRTY